MAEQWFYAAGGGQAGPVDTAELRRLAADGALRPADLVWREGMAEWVKAATVDGLFAAGASTPAENQGAGADQVAPAQILAYQGGGVPVGVSAYTMEMLRQTRPWVLFFSVLGFLLTGLVLFAGVAAMVMGATSGNSGVPVGIGLVYIVLSTIYLFPSLYLWRYGSRIAGLVAGGRVEDLERALEAQKSFWRLTGIIMIVGIALYLLVIVGVIVAAAM